MANQVTSPDCSVSRLPVLLEDVTAARARMGKDRNSLNGLTPQAYSAQLALLGALETYAAALGTAGWPLPYALRDELFLYRRLTATGRSARAR